MRSKKRFAAILLVMAMILSTTSLVAATATPVLTDIAGHPAEADINYLVGLGILAGHPDRTFRPDTMLRRSEAVKIIITATGQAELAKLLVGASPFTDVPGTHWASGYIALARNAGIVHGHGDGTFDPEGWVTYAQFAKMLVEAAGLDPTPGLVWPANYVSAAMTAGIVTVAEVPFFAAGMNAPRGDAARMTTNAVADVRHPVHGTTLAQRVFRISPVAAVTITPATSLVAPGAAVTFAGVAKTAAGVAIPDAVFTWTTSDPANSAIGANGVFVASRPGNFTVTGTADGRSATATVAVFGAATRIAVTVDRATVPANNVTEVVVTATAVDANGNRVPTYTTDMTLAHVPLIGDNGAVALVPPGAVLPVGGVETFRVRATTMADRTDTLRVSAGAGAALITGDISITSVAQVATAVTVTAARTALRANAVDTTTVSATVVDQVGAAMLSGIRQVAFAISGKGTFSPAPAAQWVVGTGATATVASIQGDPGAMVITASSAGLASGTATVTSHIAGAPAGIRVVVADNTITATQIAAPHTARFRVELVDAWGNPTVNAAANTDFTLAIGGVVLPTQGLTAAGVQTILAGSPVSGDIEIAAGLTSGVAGTHSVRVRATGMADQHFDVVVVPGTASAILASPAADTRLSAAAPNVTATAQLRDAAGNNVALSGVVITAHVTDVGLANVGRATVNGTLLTSLPGTVTATTNAAGVATFTFAAHGVVADSYGLAFSSATPAIAMGVPVPLTLVAQTPASLSLAFRQGGALVSSVAADAAPVVPVEATVTVRDSFGNPVPSWPVRLTFPEAGANIRDLVVDAAGHTAPVVTNASGEATWSFRGGRAGSYLVTATALEMVPAVTGSASFTTVPGTVIVGTAVQTAAGAAVSALPVTSGTWVQLRAFLVDNGGNALVNTGVARTVNLAAAVGGVAGGVFRLATDGTDLPGGALTISTGTLHQLVWYRPHATGTAAITAAAETTAPLFASIAAVAGANTVTLTFSEPVHWGTALDDTTHITVTVAGLARVVTQVPVRLVGAAASTLVITIGGAAVTSGQAVEVTITAAGAALIRDVWGNALIAPLVRSHTP